VADDLFNEVQTGIKTGRYRGLSVGGALSSDFKRITEVSLVERPKERNAKINKVYFSENSKPVMSEPVAVQPAAAQQPTITPEQQHFIDVGKQLEAKHKQRLGEISDKYVSKKRTYEQKVFPEKHASKYSSQLGSFLSRSDPKSAKAFVKTLDHAVSRHDELQASKKAIEEQSKLFAEEKSTWQKETDTLKKQLEEFSKAKAETEQLKEKLVEQSTTKEAKKQRTLPETVAKGDMTDEAYAKALFADYYQATRT
jgi:regulator of replication initiation timing